MDIFFKQANFNLRFDRELVQAIELLQQTECGVVTAGGTLVETPLGERKSPPITINSSVMTCKLLPWKGG